MDALLRRRAMIAAGGGSPTPPGPVTTIPYIRGGANGSYIDTGITPDNTTKVIVWARNFNPNALFLFGSRVAYGDTAFGVMSANSQYLGAIRNTYGSDNLNEVDAFTLLSGYHKYELDAGTLKVDDVTINTSSSQFAGNSNNIYLFGCNNNGSHLDASTPIDICACKIYKGGNLVRDFSPVQSPSVGLYDEVSEMVFTNSGTGSFTYGEFASNAYTPLEYIECDGNQYFDSGIRGSNSLDYVVKFRNGGTSAWPELFFAQTSNSSKRYGLAFGNSTTPNSVVFFSFNKTNKDYTYGESFAGKDLIALKSGVDHYLYENSTQKTKKTHTAATFTTDYNIFVGAGNHAGSVSYNYTGRIYYLGFSSSKNFVPAKKNNVAGMYDTYNDVFYPSATSTPFIAGPTI